MYIIYELFITYLLTYCYVTSSIILLLNQIIPVPYSVF